MASVFRYLEEQSLESLLVLYKSPWCVMAVLQSLTEMQKAIVMRLMLSSGPIAVAVIQLWFKDDKNETRTEAVDSAIKYLKKLRIVGIPDGQVKALTVDGFSNLSGEETIGILGEFAKQLKVGLSTTSSNPWMEASNNLPELLNAPPVNMIESFASVKWNAILHFLVGTADTPPPDMRVLRLLISTGLIRLGEVNPSKTGIVLTDSEDDEVDSFGVRRSRKAITNLSIPKGKSAVRVTKEGYEFLLKDTAVQLWTFMCEYLSSAEQRNMTTVEILSFLFELGFCRVGEGYAISALSKSQLRLLEDFQSFGLIYVPDNQQLAQPLPVAPPTITNVEGDVDMKDSKVVVNEVSEVVVPSVEGAVVAPPSQMNLRFFPSSLALLLTLKSSEISKASQALQQEQAALNLNKSLEAQKRTISPKLELVIEKNFKIYAYTSIGLHVSLLGLFSVVEMVLPNLVVCTLTRNSVLLAFMRGISSGQLISFLMHHMHPVMHQRHLSVPENVKDQLILWERERTRVKKRRCVFLDKFESQTTFRVVYDFVAKTPYLLSVDEDNMVMAIQHSFIPQLKDFLKKNGIIVSGLK